MSRAIDTDKLERLEKFFRLMGSDQDGEAISALRMSRRLIIATGLSWNEFVTLLMRFHFGLQEKEKEKAERQSSDVWGDDNDDPIMPFFRKAGVKPEHVKSAREAEARRREEAQRREEEERLRAQAAFAKAMREEAEKKQSTRSADQDEKIFKATNMTEDEWEARGYHDPAESLQNYLRQAAQRQQELNRKERENQQRFFRGAVFTTSTGSTIKEGFSADDVEKAIKDAIGEDE